MEEIAEAFRIALSVVRLCAVGFARRAGRYDGLHAMLFEACARHLYAARGRLNLTRNII